MDSSCILRADCQDVRSANFHLPAVRDWESPDESPDEVLIQQDMRLIRSTMWNYVGLIRSSRRLHRARRILLELEQEISEFYSGNRLTRSLIDLRNAVRTALLVVHAASLNSESKGSHFVVVGDDEVDTLAAATDEIK